MAKGTQPCCRSRVTFDCSCIIVWSSERHTRLRWVYLSILVIQGQKSLELFKRPINDSRARNQFGRRCGSCTGGNVCRRSWLGLDRLIDAATDDALYCWERFSASLVGRLILFSMCREKSLKELVDLTHILVRWFSWNYCWQIDYFCSRNVLWATRSIWLVFLLLCIVQSRSSRHGRLLARPYGQFQADFEVFHCTRWKLITPAIISF